MYHLATIHFVTDIRTDRQTDDMTIADPTEYDSAITDYYINSVSQ